MQDIGTVTYKGSEMVISLSEAIENREFSKGENILSRLSKGLSLKGRTINTLNLKETPDFEAALSDILEVHLSLADELFGKQPEAIAKKELMERLKSASFVLEKGTAEAAAEARMLIDAAIECHESAIKAIETESYLDPSTVRLFWKIWRVLDELIQFLPHDQYPWYAVQLYGVVSAGIRSKVGVHLLNKFRDEILNEDTVMEVSG